MLIVDNVACTEDDVVAVEFDEMRVMVLRADGDGEFSSWTWFSGVRGGKFEILVDGDGRATIVEGDEDEADAIAERVELMHFFCLEESDLLYDLNELSFLWFDMNIICRASNPWSLR